MRIRLLILLAISQIILFCGAETVTHINSKPSLQNDLIFGIPQEADLLLQREGFSLGYSVKYRQAIWVSYILTRKQLEKKQLKRGSRFSADPAIIKNPVHPKNYTKTGYDRGHLAPAADMTYSLSSIKNSFFMTNISPQIPGCNRGIWKRVETQVRRWAIKEKKIYVITGPIFSDKPQLMGKAEIPVPVAFYKIVFDLTPPRKMIAFIVPNRPSRKRIASFAVSVDEVERVTGYDFFSELNDRTEKRLEKSIDFSLWP